MAEITLLKQTPIWQESIDRYWHGHKKPGSFVSAVLMNDLTNAIFRADDENLGRLKEIVMYCYNNLPHHIWGNESRFQSHVDHV